MKKILFTTAVACLFLASFSSCRKCQICTKPNSPEVRVCEGDYNSYTEFGAALDSYELQGYGCN